MTAPRLIPLVLLALAACSTEDLAVSAGAGDLAVAPPATPPALTPNLPRHARLPNLNVALARCRVDGVPVIRDVTARHAADGTIAVTVRGNSCGAFINDFDYEAYTAEGERVLTRSPWGRVDALDVDDAGGFVFRGAATSSCGTLDTAQTLVLTVGRWEGQSAPVSADVAPLTRCGADGRPTVTGLTATWGDAPGRVHVEIAGEACGANVADFSFSIFDDAGVNITGRAWPEVEEVTNTDGRFLIRGVAAGCGSYEDARRIEVSVPAGDFLGTTSDPVSADIVGG